MVTSIRDRFRAMLPEPEPEPQRPETIYTCWSCGADKPESAYRTVIRHEGTWTLSKTCKACDVARSVQWARDNPERVREHARNATHKRRQVRNIPGSGVSAEEWQTILESYGRRCAYCGTDGKLTQDHVVPLSRGGRHVPGNIVPACRSCNSSKGSKTLEEWKGVTRHEVLR